MNNEFPKMVIPDTRNYAQEISDRLNGQDRVLEELAGWAKETNALLAALTKQQADQLLLTQRLALQLADLKSQP